MACPRIKLEIIIYYDESIANKKKKTTAPTHNMVQKSKQSVAQTEYITFYKYICIKS